MTKEIIRDTTLDQYIAKYNVEIMEGTMIINKKIPVREFITLRENIRKIKQIDNIIVDADRWKKENGKYTGMM